MTSELPHDLLVIGGGPAGLSAATIAGRARLRTALVDAGAPRNGVTAHSHGFFTRDGASPAALRTIGRSQLDRYDTVHIVDGRVADLVAGEAGYVATLADGARLEARRVIVATGWRDNLARTGIPGLAEVYGRSVFPCPFCDGFEQAERTVGVFVADGGAAHVGHYLARVSVLATPRLTLFTNGHAIDEAVLATHRARGNAVVADPIASLEATDGVLSAVVTASGARHPCTAGFVMGNFAEPSHDLLERLGVPHTENPIGWRVPEVDSDGATALPGLWVAGDARSAFGGIAQAAAEGYRCAAMAVGAVAMERWHGA